jgi:hypothetical protein
MSWRDFKGWLTLKEDRKKYKEYCKEYDQLYKEKIQDWDWAPVDKVFRPFLDCSPEVVAIFQPLPDKKTFKLRKLKKGNLKLPKLGKSYDMAPSLTTPDFIQAHIHPISNSVTTIFPYPSVGDFLSSILNIAHGSGMWSVVYCVYGKFMYRPKNKLLSYLKRKKDTHIQDWGEKFADDYFSLTKRGIDIQKCLNFAKGYDFEMYYLPWHGEHMPLYSTDIFERDDDDPDKYIGIPTYMRFDSFKPW